MHPLSLLQVSTVQGFMSSHTILVWSHPPEVALQESRVQALASSQLMGVKMHPVRGLQVSVVQGLLSLQRMGLLIQAPVTLLQLSLVQASPSSQLTGVLVQ